MRRIFLGWMALLSGFWIHPSQAADGQSPQSQLHRALDAQNAWLAGQASGADWNRFLLTAELEAELGKGDLADRSNLKKVLARYESPHDGLQLPEFTTTRIALSRWVGILSRPTLAQLAEMAQQARDAFRPITKAEVLSKQVAVDAALRRLDRYLHDSGPNGAGWKKYLNLAELQTELDKGLLADPEILRGIAAQFVAGTPGLELPPFSSAGATLAAYADLLAAHQNSEAKSQYEKALDQLIVDLKAAVDNPDQVNRVQMGEILGIIGGSGQASELVSAVRAQFAQPNLNVQVSQNIVTAGIEDHIDEETPIADVVLGTQIAGRGRTRGIVTAALAPSFNRATIELTLRGTTDSTTVGRNGPATIFSSAKTSLLGKKQIYINELGFSSRLAEAQCETHSTINDICINGGMIIQRVGTKRIYGSKATGEIIASQHAAARLETRMDTRTGGLLTNVNRSFNQKFRNPLARRGAFPSIFQFSTTPDWLYVLGMQARSNELAAPTPPPAIADNVQLSIRAHESLIENMTAATMAGQTARDEDFKRLMRNFHGDDLNEQELPVLLRNIGNGVEPYEDFASLFLDREAQPITPAEFATLRASIERKELTPQQFERFIHPISKAPLTLEGANAMLQNLPEESLGSLTLAAKRPLELRFDDGAFTVVIHSTAHSSRTGVERKLPMNISATYKVDRKGGTLIATRQGEIEVNPPDYKQGDRLDIQQTAARRTLRTRFEEILKPEFQSTGLKLRGRWKKLGELPWTQFVMDNGWLAAGWTPVEATAQRNRPENADNSTRTE